MDLGVHLPLMEFGDEGQSPGRLHAAVDAARDNGFAAISSNDHFLFSTPWLDGPTALAAAIERSGEMELATTISLVAQRGPVPLAKTLAALDILSGGRMTAGVGPGSSRRDYDAVGVPFDDRWKRFDEAVAILRALLGRAPRPDETTLLPAARRRAGAGPRPGGRGSSVDRELGVEGWGFAGSLASRTAGLRRPTTRPPRDFESGRELLADELARQGRDVDWVPECARDHVDVGYGGPGGARSRSARRACAASQARSGGARRAGMRRLRRDVRGVALASSPRRVASASTSGPWATSRDSWSLSRRRWLLRSLPNYSRSGWPSERWHAASGYRNGFYSASPDSAQRLTPPSPA